MGKRKKGGFSRIAYQTPVSILRSVIAQSHGGKEELLSSVCSLLEVQFIFLQRMTLEVDFFHGHLVHRERSGLVRADVGHGTEGLDGREPADQRILPHHFSGSEGQRNCHHGRKCLGDRRYGQGDGGEEHEHEGLAPEEAGDEEDRAQEKNGQGESPPELGKPLLERRLDLFFLLEHAGDLPDLRVHASGHDHSGGPTVGHGSPLVGHVHSVAYGEALFFQRICVFFRRHGLAGKGGFLDFQLNHLGEPQIGRYNFPCIEQNHVPRYDGRSRDHGRRSVSQHECIRRGHAFEGGHGLLGAKLLDEPDDGVQDNDNGDGNGVGSASGESGDHSSGHENQNHEILELVEEHGEGRSFLLLAQFVRTIFCKALRRLPG